MSRIEISKLQFSYGKTPVLKDISGKIASGAFTALVGPNGCGKSTLLKAVMGFLPIESGTITIDGEKTESLGRRALAKRIGYLPQECQCPDYMTLGELIELAGYSRYSLLGGPTEKDRDLFRRTLDIVGLADKASTQVNTLSGGQRQRAWIAMVLAQDTDTILMDEPVNHLDMKYQYAVLELVRDLCLRHGKTVVVVLHDLNLAAAFADDVIMMRAGGIEAAGPANRVLSADNIDRVFDLKTDVFRRGERLVCLPKKAGYKQAEVA